MTHLSLIIPFLYPGSDVFTQTLKTATTTNTINLTITATTVFNPARCIVGLSNRYDPRTFVSQMGGDAIQCSSFEQVDEAFRSAEYSASFGGTLSITVSGTLGNQTINEAFSDMQNFQIFLKTNNLPVLTEKEYLDKLNAEYRAKFYRAPQ